MIGLNDLLERFVEHNQRILGDNLVGIYLHGSAAMGCFNKDKSDVDLLVVVNSNIPDEAKSRYMDMAVELNADAPAKGLELSIVRKRVCRPFVYPTPFELHFSNTHLEWYKTDPAGYIAGMKGTDKDLAAHFTIIFHRGKCLFGEAIRDVFEEVGREEYFDSIWYDVRNAAEEIAENPAYFILNLCRVLANKREGLILSKREGGEWGMDNVPRKYRELISQAHDEYSSVGSLEWDEKSAVEYAEYMLDRIASG